jgi:long-chain acyl-CoA synthetase
MAENKKSTGGIDLSNIVAQLKSCAGQRVQYYQGGKIVSRAYRALAADVADVAARLRMAGIRKGDCVGILAHNSYAWLVMDLAIIDVQAVCVAFPVEHFAHAECGELAEMYELRLLVTDQPALLDKKLAWISDIEAVQDAAFSCREVKYQPLGNKDDLFSLSFSSGTSGKVKCLKFGRRGTNGLIAAFGRDFTFTASDAILAFLPLATIQQRWMLYTSIYYGFDLCLSTPTRLFDSLKEMKPTIVCAAPLLFETVESHYLLLDARLRKALGMAAAALSWLPDMLAAPARRRLFRRIHDVFGGRVRFFLVGSAPSRTGTLKFYESIGMPLYEAWGLSEVGFLTWNLPGKSRLGSVGVPVYHDALDIAPDGEIFVRHENLPCLGYYAVPAEEEAVTFPRPGVLATGDLGYFDQGFLYITGRKKDIIITRGGVKIQPAELEAEIKRNDYVEHAVVFGGDEMPALKAVVSVRGGSGDPRSSIQASVDALNRRKPASSKIARVIFTDQKFDRDNQLLNRNLKVDRKRVFERFKTELVG